MSDSDQSADRPTVTAGSGHLENIGTAECLALLGTAHIGRLVVVVADEPDVFPVNFVLDGEDVILRTDVGLKLAQSTLRRIAFEVDEIDEARHEGWSVVIKGRGIAHDLEDDDPATAHFNSGPAPWPAGAKRYTVRVVPRLITGRRLVRSGAESA